MFKSLLVGLAVLLAVTVLSGAVCRFTDQMRPVSVNFDELAENRFKFVYVSENYSSRIDQAFLDMHKIGDNTYNATTTYIRDDGTENMKNYTINYKDGVMNNTYPFDDGFGIKFTTTSYILAKTDEGSMLVYLCSDSEVVYNDADMRYIIVPVGITLSDEQVNQLMAVDRKFNFNSKLVKLPNQHPMAEGKVIS